MKKLFITICSITLGFASLNAQQENILPDQGNVGLGTLNPSAKLDVKGNVKIDSSMMVKKNLVVEGDVDIPHLPPINSAAGKDFVIVKSDGGLEKLSADVVFTQVGEVIYVEKGCETDDLAHPTWSNGLNKIYSHCPQVQVGLATNDPQFTLDVRGTTYSNKLLLGDASSGSAPTTFYLKTVLAETASDELFLIENADRKVFQINNNGTVKARDIVVNARLWPDYVFEPDYKLTPLSEVEAYLKKHKHLPEVPDAKTMETQGNSLAETDRILMQKVEELTLYLIEQNKINQQQAELLKKQAQEIEELKLQLQK